jgi:hypothetical protein
VECGACGKANRSGARFGGSCGSALIRCSECDAELGPDLAFCDSCGTRVGRVPDPPATTKDDAVRKTVTVVFADLGGSTSFGERTDAELISFDEDDLGSAMAQLETRHRTLAGDAYGSADAFVVACESGTSGLEPDVTARLSPLCVKSYSAGNVLLAVWSDDHSYTVVVLDNDGHATNCEFFTEDQWSEAVARFDALATA